jgi:uncharacterized protein with NRDE domain
MCTVTYIPTTTNNFILTSSRDVPFAREKALFPKKYIENDVVITYPKDGRAGGTWIGHSDKKRLICLLNGGFENHYLTTDPNTKYRKSRGIIVLDLLKENEINSALSNIDLNQIEPFTLVIVDWNKNLQLIELVWDGTKKHIKKLPQEMHIWSSATLYDTKMKQLREKWFDKWQNVFCPSEISDEELNLVQANRVLNFHHQAGIGDCNVDVIMKREKVGTVSITQVTKLEDDITMEYEEIT